MKKVLTGKKANIVGLLIILTAIFGFSKGGNTVHMTSSKLSAYNDYSPEKNTDKENTREDDQYATKNLLYNHFQRGLDELDQGQRDSMIAAANYELYTAQALRIVYLLVGLAGILIWAKNSFGLKLFYPMMSSAIILLALMSFFNMSSSTLTVKYSSGVLSQIFYAIMVSGFSITMMLSIVLLILVPLISETPAEAKG